MKTTHPLRVGLVVPHIFMQDALLAHVIFSPGTLALSLARELARLSANLTLYSPGTITSDARVRNLTADMSLFEQELAGRGYGYVELLKKHPMTFIAMARQVQSELIAKAFADANRGQLDVVHIYTNEEDIALPFAQFCAKPVVFTHHDPFSFLIKYKNNFPKYKHLNWVSLSHAQRNEMPADTNWVANIYHGLPADEYRPRYTPHPDTYVAYLGRIIEPKGVHLAIAAVKHYNQHIRAKDQPMVRLIIAGQHYAGHAKDTYWHDQVLPHIDNNVITYAGFAKTTAQKQELLGNAQALLMPSTFNEPFGMVALEAMACGTPVIGTNSGAIAEVVGADGGIVVPMHSVQRGDHLLPDEAQIVSDLASALQRIPQVDRRACRARFDAHFTADRMAHDYLAVYRNVTGT